MELISSAGEVIDALGGATQMAARLNQKPNTVGNWRLRGKIPPEHFLAVSEALRASGKAVSPEVFGMKPAEENFSP